MVFIEYLIISFVGALALIFVAKGVLAKLLYREADYYDKQPKYDATSPTGLAGDLKVEFVAKSEPDSHGDSEAESDAEPDPESLSHNQRGGHIDE